MCRSAPQDETSWHPHHFEPARADCTEYQCQDGNAVPSHDVKSPNGSYTAIDGMFGSFHPRAPVEGLFDYRADNQFYGQYPQSVREKEVVPYLGTDLVEHHAETHAPPPAFGSQYSIRSAFGSIDTNDAFGQDTLAAAFDARLSKGPVSSQPNATSNGSDPTAPKQTVPSTSSNTVEKEAKSAAQPDPNDASACRSYRQHTSELIIKLDKLLDFRLSQLKSKSKCSKAAAKKQAKAILKPRSRNVVLKQAVELIWRIQCDEQALAAHNQKARSGDQPPSAVPSFGRASSTCDSQPAESRNKDVDFGDLAKPSVGYSACLSAASNPIQRKLQGCWWDQRDNSNAYFSSALAGQPPPFCWSQPGTSSAALQALASSELLGMKAAWMADFPPRFVQSATRSW